MPTGTERPGDDDMASRPVRHARIIAASVRSIPPSWRGDGLELLILHWLEELKERLPTKSSTPLCRHERRRRDRSRLVAY